METIEYQYSVKVLVKMTRAEIMHSIQMSQAHYDSVCRMASEPGPGAFLNAFKNRLEDQDTAQCPMTFRDLDILAKILEIPGSDFKLKVKVVETLLAVRAEETRVNNGP